MSDGAGDEDAIDLIRGSAAGIANRQELSRIRALRYTEPGFDRSVWQEMCDMGWLALRLPEEQGGVGFGMTACCVLMEELGAALAPEPLIAAMMTAQVIGAEKVDQLVSGQQVILPAWQEQRGSINPGSGTLYSNGKVDGLKCYIPMASGADAFLVATDRGWVWVEKDAPGVTLDTSQTQDGGHFGTLRLEQVSGPIVSTVDSAAPLSEATLSASAYMLGLIEESLARTLDYLCEREQFGQRIGSFQALQHRMVDLKLEAALTRASVNDAARCWDLAPGSKKALIAISRSKARASATAMLVTRQAIQLHGGIGYTDEHDIGLYLRKAMVMAAAYGSAQLHRQHFASLSLNKSEVSL